MAKVVALLESMWGWGGYNDPGAEAPHFFRINPDNHSGRRLYSLVGSHELVVTNCCRIVQETANDHGKPDLEWVRQNLQMASREMNLLLVCGRIAKDSFERVASIPSGITDGIAYISGNGTGEVFHWYAIDHPAARRWSHAKIEQTQAHIERLLCSK